MGYSAGLQLGYTATPANLLSVPIYVWAVSLASVLWFVWPYARIQADVQNLIPVGHHDSRRRLHG